MKLNEYIACQDHLIFWRLDPGEHQNLLDEAIEMIEELRDTLTETRAFLARGRRGPMNFTQEGIAYWPEMDAVLTKAGVAIVKAGGKF